MRFGSILAAATAVPLIAATHPVRLQPSSAWVLDYAANSCRLSRTFGEGNSKTVLEFESDAPGQTDLLVVGKGVDSYSQEVPVRFLPVQDKAYQGFPAVGARTGLPAVLWSAVPLLPDSALELRDKKASEARPNPGVRPPPIDLAQRAAERAERQAFASNATELEIDARRSRPLILETGSLGEPIKMFDKCSRDSLRDWGVDPDVEDRIVRPVWTPDPSKWFSSDDYPVDMILKGAESDVKVRLLVDASGRVTKCTSLSHFQEKEFNQIVCDEFMKRARFEPAELADGTRVPSYYVNRIVFRIGQ
jgi:hypothetical protein